MNDSVIVYSIEGSIIPDPSSKIITLSRKIPEKIVLDLATKYNLICPGHMFFEHESYLTLFEFAGEVNVALQPHGLMMLVGKANVIWPEHHEKWGWWIDHDGNWSEEE